MGADIPPQEPTDVSEDFEIMPCNWDSLVAFLRCETQWRVAATMAGVIWLGLDYDAVDVVLHRTAAPDAVFFDLQVMEAAALEVLGEERS
ncbi:MAG: DUF1799 domain-containing protein [Pseudodonghicola sp.]